MKKKCSVSKQQQLATTTKKPKHFFNLNVFLPIKHGAVCIQFSNCTFVLEKKMGPNCRFLSHFS